MTHDLTAKAESELAPDAAATSNVIEFPNPIPDGAHRTLDAIVHGDIFDDDPIWDRQIEVAVAGTIEAFDWKPVKSDFESFLKQVCTHTARKNKDGPAFLQGALEGKQRKQAAVTSLDMMVLDIDVGQDSAELLDNLRRIGWFAIVATSHNHMTTTTTVKRDKIVEALTEDREPTKDDVVAYLADVKRVRQSVLEGAELVDAKRSSPDGLQMVLRHQPQPKLRIILPLKERFVIADKIVGRKKLQDVVNDWRAMYKSVSDKIGAYYDRTCSDLGRGFFFPSHRPGAPWRIDVLPGVLLDLTKIEIDGAEGAFEQALKLQAGGKNDGKDPAGKLFMLKYSKRFSIATLFSSWDPDGEIEQRSRGGHIHKCPFIDEHTPPASGREEDDKGFFCTDAADNMETGQCVAHCSHDACSKRDRIDYVKALLDREGKTWADLEEFVDGGEIGDPDFDRTLFVDESKPAPDPATTYATVEAATTAIVALVKGTDVEAEKAVAASLTSSPFNRINMAPLLELLVAHSGFKLGVLKDAVKEARAARREAEKTTKIEKAQKQKPSNKPKPAEDAWLPADAIRKEDAFVLSKIVKRDGELQVVETFICRSFEPIEKTIAPGQTNPGLRIKFGDKEIAIGSGQLHGSKDELAKFLHTDNGLECGTTRESHDALAELLRCAMHDDRLPEVMEAQTPGWFAPDIWVCANGKVVGSDTIRLSTNTGYSEHAPDGVGDGAREQAIYDQIWTSGPTLWRLGDLLGLAAPCQKIVGCRSIGLIPDGIGGGGKTTMAYAQAARAGSPDEKSGKGGLIRVTDSPESIEIPLRNATGSPFALDELGLMKDPAHLGRYLYAVAGGSGKPRMKRSADGMRAQYLWDCVSSLSTERPVVDLLRSAGKAMGAGIVRRFPSVSVAGLCPKNAANGKLAHAIKQMLFANYGHTLPVFVESALIGIDREQANKEWRALVTVVSDGDEYLKEPAELFGLLWWAGLQAARVGLTAGLTEESVEVVVRAAWSSFIESGVAETMEPGKLEIAALREAIIDGWDRTILDVNAMSDAGSWKERVGYYRAEEKTIGSVKHPAGVFILQTHLDALTGGTGSRNGVIKALGGWLTRSDQDEPTRNYIHGVGLVRHYHLDYAEFARADKEAEGPFEQAAKADR